MTDNALEQAINLIKAGDTEQGGKILVNLLEKDQKIEDAWVWLYACVKSDDQRIYCLKKILDLNPNNTNAKINLAKLIEQQADLTKSIPSKQASDEIEHLNISILVSPKKRGRKPKHKPEIQETEIEPEKSKKLSEPHVFNLDNYNVVLTKPGENPFAENERLLNDFPEIESGMYGNKLVVGSISITSYDYPKCVELGVIRKSQCLKCDFFSLSDCPIRHNLSILYELQTIFAQNKRYRLENRERRDAIIETIFTELKNHGRPLHYEILTQIIVDRHPHFHLTPLMILHFMSWHPDKFEWVDKGVYRAK